MPCSCTTTTRAKADLYLRQHLISLFDFCELILVFNVAQEAPPSKKRTVATDFITFLDFSERRPNYLRIIAVSKTSKSLIIPFIKQSGVRETVIPAPKGVVHADLFFRVLKTKWREKKTKLILCT